MDAKKEIRGALTTVLDGLGFLNIEIELEQAGDLRNGDYSSVIAKKILASERKTKRNELEETGFFSKDEIKNVSTIAKLPSRNPDELAQIIVGKLGQVPGISKIEAVSGFINFHLEKEVFAAMLQEIISDPTSWGRNDLHEAERIMVEYTDPNPFKEFHIGHLVPNALGESTARLFEFASAEVKRANYQGDVGIHVAKSLFILLEKGITDPTIADLSTAYPEGSTRYEEDPEAKQAIDALNKKIYDNLSGQESDDTVNALYEKGRALSLAHFEEIYKTLGTKFDYYFFESATGPRGLEVVRAHPDIFEESEGAIVFKGEQYGLHTRVFVNKFGLPTYEAKDLGLAEIKRETYPFDLTLTVTGNEQGEYFKVVKKAMEMALPDLAGKIAYKTNGMLRFAEGKMSSRTGNIVRGEDLIDDLTDVAAARAKESRADDPAQLAQEIAVAAIKYQILKQGFGKDIIFDRERALSLEGDSGPYVQYTYARATQVVARAANEGIKPSVDANAAAIDLVRLMHRFPVAVERAAALLEPHLVANFLIEFAASFNRWYAEVRIVDGSTSSPQAATDTAHRVAITEAARITLKNGLYLLGIPAPEKM